MMVGSPVDVVRMGKDAIAAPCM